MKTYIVQVRRALTQTADVRIRVHDDQDEFDAEHEAAQRAKHYPEQITWDEPEVMEVMIEGSEDAAR